MSKTPSFKRSTERKFLPIGLLRVSPHAQRDLSRSWVSTLLSIFDPDKMRYPVVSHRGEFYHVIDGQHTVEALKEWLGPGWENQTIECLVHEGLTDAQEADLFLSLNRTRTVAAFDKFVKSIQADYPDHVHINAVVVGAGLKISRDPKTPGGIRAVNALLSVYKRSNAHNLAKTLRVIRDSFGDSGFDGSVIEGLGYVFQRYDGVLKEQDAIDRLRTVRGGVNGLLGKTEVMRKSTGNSKALCVAAAAVDIINIKRGKQRLASWWT